MATDLQGGSAVSAGAVPHGDTVLAHGAGASVDASFEGLHVVRPQTVEVLDGVLVAARTIVVTSDSRSTASGSPSRESAEQGAANGEIGAANQSGGSLSS